MTNCYYLIYIPNDYFQIIYVFGVIHACQTNADCADQPGKCCQRPPRYFMATRKRRLESFYTHSREWVEGMYSWDS